MSLAAVQAKVNTLASQKLLPVLLERGAVHHTKNWKDCDCSFCALKRKATNDIATSPLHMVGRVAREERREQLRQHYRPLLNMEFNR